MRYPLVAQPAYAGQEIAFRLDPNTHPAGMAIDPVRNQLLWTPNELDGPGRYRVDVIAYDAAAPTKQTIQRLEVIVTEVNQPPILEGTSLGPISPGSLAQIPFAATDRDRRLMVSNIGSSIRAIRR